MNAFEAVAFDYDGTLFDTRSAIVHCIQRTFEESGRPIPAHDAVCDTVKSGVSLQDTFLILDVTLGSNTALQQDLIRAYRKLYLEEGTPLLQPFTGSREVLERLHTSGIKCIVVSNKSVAAIRRSLDDSRLTSFVELVLGDEPGIPRKPDPAIVTDHILPKFAGLRSEQILMVGDTETDIRFAKGSGMVGCWASYGYGEAERCRALAPDHEISSLEELLSLVDRR